MILTVDEALRKIDIPVAKFDVCSSLKEVERSVKRLGFPIVLKLISPKVIHKTESKGVVIAHDMHEVRAASSGFLVDGKVLVQENVRGVEFFLGIKNDPSFGHVLLAGVGGIFVEVYRDIAFRVCPITKKDAKEMLDELKGRALLEGVRGNKPVDESALMDAMIEISKLPQKISNLEELDINPAFVNEKGILAVDARIVLRD